MYCSQVVPLYYESEADIDHKVSCTGQRFCYACLIKGRTLFLYGRHVEMQLFVACVCIGPNQTYQKPSEGFPIFNTNLKIFRHIQNNQQSFVLMNGITSSGLQKITKGQGLDLAKVLVWYLWFEACISTQSLSDRN